MEYIRRGDSGQADGCLFCDVPAAGEDEANPLRAMRRESGPHRFNRGMNLGPVAGAGIADHVHLHLVPRWGGDTNFMPVVGQTRVLPELLGETYQRLCPQLFDGGAEVVESPAEPS